MHIDTNMTAAQLGRAVLEVVGGFQGQIQRAEDDDALLGVDGSGPGGNWDEIFEAIGTELISRLGRP